MEHFQNHEREYSADEYSDFEDNPFDEFTDSPTSGTALDDDDLDSDFDADFELSARKWRKAADCMISSSILGL
ncbi:hypothetical protein ACH5RR_034569 [Cinchona calisaya]|uniref:Uncharacterized protein n=1 Tax=Cinchona calisaya TaxID=153742 RepID=A0ABD2YCJ1_9GENT